MLAPLFCHTFSHTEAFSIKLYRSRIHVKILTVNGQWLWLSGRAVASDARDPRFESSHRQTFKEHLSTANCVEKTNIKKKRPGIHKFFKYASPVFATKYVRLTLYINCDYFVIYSQIPVIYKYIFTQSALTTLKVLVLAVKRLFWEAQLLPFFNYRSQLAMWPVKSFQMLPKNDFTRKIKHFDTFTKIA